MSGRDRTDLLDLADQPATRWWAGHAADLSDPVVAGRTAWDALRSGLFTIAAPGNGATLQRWAALAALAAADVTLAKIGEAHADAMAILGELAGPDPDGQLWAVWAAVTPALEARLDGGQWRLTGTKPWSSGASCCTRALVTAQHSEGEQLFAIDATDSRIRADPLSWPAVGMSGTASMTLNFSDVPGTPVGAVGEYLSRPGFWQGGAGIAACWYGGAHGIAAPLRRKVAAAPQDPFRAAGLGAVHAALASAAAMLTVTAEGFDTPGPDFDGFAAAMTARAVVEESASAVIDRVGRVLGPGPLAGDRAHARRVADLGLFLRQSHGEADLAALGRRVAAS